MNSNVENIILEHLKSLRNGMEIVMNDIKDLKHRAGSMERQLVGIQDTLVHHASRIDRVEERLARIEKRLDLVEA